jgi:polysaccharide pyruvyl transferase CsaB
MRAVLCGYYGQGNGGDEALLASLLQMLPEHITPVVLSGNPMETRNRYGVEACDRKALQSVLKALKSADAFIWGGGSLLQDATSFASPLYYGGLMGLAQWMGLKTIAWAQGIGPLQRGLSRWVAHQAFAGCQAISVRDRGSATWLKQWHLSGLQAPDPVWALAATPPPPLEIPGPRVAVALRSHPWLTPERLSCLTQALVAFQTQTQTSLLLVPFQPVQDLAIAQAIQPSLPGPSQIVRLGNPQALKGLFQEVEMAIAMRFHGLIMAAAEGCRCFALSYDPKVSQLMTDLTLPGWELSDLPADPQLICQTWLKCYEAEGLPPEQRQSLIQQALQHRALLTDVLGQSP